MTDREAFKDAVRRWIRDPSKTTTIKVGNTEIILCGPSKLPKLPEEPMVEYPEVEGPDEGWFV